MAGVSMTSLSAMPDALMNGRYEVALRPNSLSADFMRTLKLRCQTCDIPMPTVEQVTVGLHGHDMNYRGRGTFPKSMTITFSEMVTADVMKYLYEWKELVVGTHSGNGEYRDQYSCTGLAGIVDNYGRVAIQQRIFKMWLMEITNLSVDGQGSAPVLFSCTFSLDWVEPADSMGITMDGSGEDADS